VGRNEKKSNNVTRRIPIAAGGKPVFSGTGGRGKKEGNKKNGKGRAPERSKKREDHCWKVMGALF